jgi:hypothetical protein
MRSHSASPAGAKSCRADRGRKLLEVSTRQNREARLRSWCFNETCCARWIAACRRAHPVVGRYYNLCPKSRGLRAWPARRSRFASHFPFAFRPGSTGRPLSCRSRVFLKRKIRDRTAPIVRLIFWAISGGLIPEASNFRSISSSVSVQGRPAGRGPVICPSPSAFGRLAGSRCPAEKLSATGISRFPEECPCDPVPAEVCGRSPVASPQPDLDQAPDQSILSWMIILPESISG